MEPDHPFIAHTLSLLARLYFEQGHTEQAEIFWKRSFAMVEKTLGPQHLVTAERLNDLAELSVAQGRYMEAQALCERALSICEERCGSEHPDTIKYRQHLTSILSKIEMERDDDRHPAPSVC